MAERTNIRDWSATLGTIKIRIELVFEPGHEVRILVFIYQQDLEKLTYPSEKRMLLFSNQPTIKNWDGYISDCQ